MYNRYIPRNGTYTRVAVEEPPPQSREEPSPAPPQAPPSGEERTGPTAAGGRRSPPDLAALLFGKGEGGGGVSGLLRGLKLDSLDSGDILLLLIVLFLLVEGDDIELVIALGLVLIMALNGDEDAKEGRE